MLLGAMAGGAVLLTAPVLFQGGGGASGAPSANGLRTVRPGKLTVASIGEMPLFAVRDGVPIGVEAEMMRRICKRLDLELVLDVMEWSACLASVPSGRADCVGGNMAWTDKRAASMLITDAVYYSAIFAMMRQDQPFHESIAISDLAGHSVGTVSGFSYVPDLRRVPGTREVKLYDTTDATVRDVIAGRLDFAFLDAPIIDYMIQQNSGWGLKQVPLAANRSYPILGEKQHTVWGLGGQNFALFDAVNQGIAWLKRTGQTQEILREYGLTNPAYLEAPTTNIRLGFDRDERGAVIGRFAHAATDRARPFD